MLRFFLNEGEGVCDGVYVIAWINGLFHGSALQDHVNPLSAGRLAPANRGWSGAGAAGRMEIFVACFA